MSTLSIHHLSRVERAFLYLGGKPGLPFTNSSSHKNLNLKSYRDSSHVKSGESGLDEINY